MSVIEIISLIPQFIIGIGTLIIAATGIYALTSWRKELPHKRRLEIAEEILSRMQNLAYKIERIRHSIIEPQEMNDEKANESYYIQYANVYVKRFKSVIDDINQFGDVTTKAKMYFHEEFLESVKEFLNEVNKVDKLISNIEVEAAHLTRVKQQNDSDWTTALEVYKKVVNKLRYMPENKDDEINTKMETCINSAVIYIRKKLKIEKI